MRYIVKIPAILLLASAAVSCSVDDRAKELSASFSGRLVDADTGENVPVEYSTATLLLGDNGFNPLQPVSYYIYPDGTFKNDKVYPGNYEIYAQGAFKQVDTLHAYDLKGVCNFDIKVVPNVNLKVKDISVTSAGKCKATVEYSVNADATSLEISILWSQYPYPGAVTASIDDKDSAYSHQKKYMVSGKTGSSSLTSGALDKGVTYYCRVGAKVQGSDYWNYTPQHMVTSEGVIE